MLKIGIHQSFDGLANAVRECKVYGFSTFQIFTRNNRNLKQRQMFESDFSECNALLQEYGIKDVVIHAPYVMNPASGETDKRERAIETIKSDLALANRISANVHYVLHPGAYTEYSSEECIQLLFDTLRRVDCEAGSVRIAVETMAGQGTQLLSDLYQLGWFLQVIRDMPHVEVCVDTCHVYASGIHIDQLLATFAIFNAKNKLGVIHVNDSQRGFGSCVDRHAPVGEGCIQDLREIVTDLHDYAPDAPIILETPEESLVRDAKIVSSWL